MSQKIDIYQVDAFVKGSFSGNPAAVCPLEDWLPDDLLQKIAEENNLSETAYVVREDSGYRIRWFTPATEVRLCGHATLASGFIYFEKLGHPLSTIEFNCLSGKISVTKSDDLYTLDFPLDDARECPCPKELIRSLGKEPSQTLRGRDDYLLIFDHENIIRDFEPDFKEMTEADARGCLISAPGNDYDVVCRGFFPQTGIDEDPATGSAQTTLAAYWPDVLGKNNFTCCQLSARKGYFQNERINDRVKISGACRLFLNGEIYIG